MTKAHAEYCQTHMLNPCQAEAERSPNLQMVRVNPIPIGSTSAVTSELTTHGTFST